MQHASLNFLSILREGFINDGNWLECLIKSFSEKNIINAFTKSQIASLAWREHESYLAGAAPQSACRRETQVHIRTDRSCSSAHAAGQQWFSGSARSDCHASVCQPSVARCQASRASRHAADARCRAPAVPAAILQSDLRHHRVAEPHDRDSDQARSA